MELPLGMVVDGSAPGLYVLKLNRSLYGLKQASLNWFEFLRKGLFDRGFIASQVDPCVYYREDCVVLVYVDDCFIVAKSSDAIDSFLNSLRHGDENFDFQDEGDMTKYLGVDINHLPDGSFELRQPYLIDRIIDTLGLQDSHTVPTPSVKPLLHKDLDGLPRKNSFHYRSIIGMLGYLQNSTRPDIAMAVHQCARFNEDPKLSHERAVKRIGRYLKGTADKGIRYTPDPSKGLECFVDADFAGGWAQADSDNADSVLSRSGYFLSYAGCPIYWSSKMQTEIALSTAESEYIALSSALREVIPFMILLTELSVIFDITLPKPKVYCKVFEDNESCIAMATKNRFSPRTKHIALKYHHFRQYVDDGRIIVESINTKEQTADLLTKPLDTGLFEYLRRKLMGW
jgi:histone deacetylase 1/2